MVGANTGKPGPCPSGKTEPTARGQSAPVTITAPAPGKLSDQARQVVAGKIRPVKDRAFTGAPAPAVNVLSKQLAGAIGEEVVIQHLRKSGFADAGLLSTHLKSERNNLPADLIHDHEIIEVKTGQASNGPGAQQWRLTIGEPGVKEKAWLAKATPEQKAKLNARKQAEIHTRKQQAIAEVAKELGYPVKGRTMTVILNPATKTADIFAFAGFHDRIGWNSDQARQGYVGSVRYG